MLLLILTFFTFAWKQIKKIEKFIWIFIFVLKNSINKNCFLTSEVLQQFIISHELVESICCKRLQKTAHLKYAQPLPGFEKKVCIEALEKRNHRNIVSISEKVNTLSLLTQGCWNSKNARWCGEVAINIAASSVRQNYLGAHQFSWSFYCQLKYWETYYIIWYALKEFFHLCQC